MVKILSVDGGGIRGIVASTILEAIENRMADDTPMHERVDIITGTSTGGLIACGLTVPDESGNPKFGIADLIETYQTLGKDVFNSTFWHKLKTLWGLVGPRYPITGLENVLEKKYSDAKLKDALTEIIVCTYDLTTREPVIFSSKDDALNDITMVEAAMGTASVPSYFPSVSVTSIPGNYNLIDGGIFAVNPALCALAFSKVRNPSEPIDIISIGNGHYQKSLPYSETKDWGMLQWAMPVTDVILDGVNDAIHFQTKILCNADGGEYVRLQFDLPKSLEAMDNADRSNIDKLRETTLEYIRQNPDVIDAAVEILKK